MRRQQRASQLGLSSPVFEALAQASRIGGSARWKAASSTLSSATPLRGTASPGRLARRPLAVGVGEHGEQEPAVEVGLWRVADRNAEKGEVREHQAALCEELVSEVRLGPNSSLSCCQ